jgi:hypothetical protein
LFSPAKRLVNGLDLTLSATKTTSPLALMSALNSLSYYNAKMIRNRAEAMSCGGCHQNSNDTEIAPNVNWPKSRFFVHVDEQGVLFISISIEITIEVNLQRF